MITLDSLKHYDEKSKELISTKQNKLEGTNNQIVSFDQEGNVVAKDFSENAEKITYSNDKYNQFTNVNSVLDNLLEKVYYVKPVCTLISNKASGTYEMGAVITAPIIFNWSVNKEIVTQTLTDCSLGSVTVREAIYDKNITEDKKFTLTVSDGENESTSSVNYKFMNNVFWGSSVIPSTYNSDFINSLQNKELKNTTKGMYLFNADAGQYGFWAVQSDMEISTVWIGGFEVTVDYVDTIQYTNSQGYIREYNIYKTTKSGLGSFSAEIR
jgi:hypothetical protein